MSATIEIKYYNSFWLKKMATIANVSSLETTGVTEGVGPNTANTIGTVTSGRELTITSIDAESIGLGQEISYTISSILYVHTIINLAVSGANTIIVLSSNIIAASVPAGTVLTFGKITNNVWLPSRYDNNVNTDWYIEETRIRGGYNNTTVDLGVKAYIVEESPQRERLINTLIYSGVFNSKTGVNNTNQFSVAEDITRTVDPAQGSIQKLYAEDTNLIIFQELKVSRALIDKDAIYSAEGQAMTTSGAEVIGQIQSYAGNYGIGSHPESFAVYGYRKYFVDNYQNIVLRLSQDGITEVSAYGMFDYFRDELSNKNLFNGYIYGIWDIHSKQYILSIQPSSGKPSTLSFDEDVNGWVSRLSYTPNSGISLRNNFYTFKEGAIWKHYVATVPKAQFYGIRYTSEVTLVFNPSVSESKSFLTVNYEGSQNWSLIQFVTETDVAAPISEYYFPSTLLGLQDQLFQNKFKKKESKYFSNLLNISNIQNGDVLYADPIANPNNGQIVSGVKGFYAIATFSCANATLDPTINKRAELFAVSAEYVESSY
jgi:hypothetical protein